MGVHVGSARVFSGYVPSGWPLWWSACVARASCSYDVTNVSTGLDRLPLLRAPLQLGPTAPFTIYLLTCLMLCGFLTLPVSLVSAGTSIHRSMHYMYKLVWRMIWTHLAPTLSLVPHFVTPPCLKPSISKAQRSTILATSRTAEDNSTVCKLLCLPRDDVLSDMRSLAKCLLRCPRCTAGAASKQAGGGVVSERPHRGRGRFFTCSRVCSGGRQKTRRGVRRPGASPRSTR